jgi:ATP-dependent helicase/nuclease subunit A
VHSAKGLEWPIVFWADLGRMPAPKNQPILIGRETLALKDPDSEDKSPAWLALEEEEKAEAAAEAKRLWYVAATRAMDRLIVSGFSDKKPPKGSAVAALGAVLDVAGANGTLSYRDAWGQEFTAMVHRARADAELPEIEEPSFTPLPVPDAPRPLRTLAGRPRHSATELMSYGRCARRHWFKYVAGVREPPVLREGPEWGSAVARGQVVHDVLEHYREELDLSELLEVALGRWDPDRPPPESEPGRKYRDQLTAEISAVRDHPAYRALDDVLGRERELEFIYLASQDAFLQGAIDLAAPQGDGLAALDVKTGGGDAETLRRKADGYALQRSVYVGALEAIGGRPVERFAFHFASSGVQVGGEVSQAMREQGAAEVQRALAAMGSEAPELTKYPAECRFCGYRRVKWCAGVEATGA